MRRDLPPAQQVVQSCHAAIEATRHFVPLTLEHPSVIVCGVKSQQVLHNALKKITSQGVRCQAFYEPDIGNLITSIATEPVYEEKRRIFRPYQCLKLEEKTSYIIEIDVYDCDGRWHCFVENLNNQFTTDIEKAYRFSTYSEAEKFVNGKKGWSIIGVK